jgi:hypothetical protein
VSTNGETNVNDRTIKLGATLGAVALAFAAPAVASAQDRMDNAMPADNAAPAYSAPAATPMASDQLDRLQSLGFLNQSEVLTSQVDQNAPTTFDALPSDQLASTLDGVKVDDADGVTYSLREFLASQGVDPSTIVALSVSDNNVVIAHT